MPAKQTRTYLFICLFDFTFVFIYLYLFSHALCNKINIIVTMSACRLNKQEKCLFVYLFVVDLFINSFVLVLFNLLLIIYLF